MLLEGLACRLEKLKQRHEQRQSVAQLAAAPAEQMSWDDEEEETAAAAPTRAKAEGEWFTAVCDFSQTMRLWVVSSIEPATMPKCW